ncbi:multiple sugar transport system permease protein/putative aldouronate transport system permease protein [Kribbella antiqua]|uniref:Multiple sugar transport system permease protein/putative aldouronate transport system permease protein n=1 Tax=Kribbella antiqua TaxID=2512217 RepID=A0A4R2II93_9ACTN|nr:carbohydrate ABC transporter permease [Kribbella antiqua]TCO44002.1 multiple sugar transport system permease protein/putative aldouronate transport system permease protein [Kribbella antiqua]
MRPIWKERPSFGYQSVKAVVLGGFALVIVVPIMVVISTSLASDQDIIDAGGYVLWPSHPTVKAYQTLFSGGLMGRAILVSVFVTVVGTAIALAVTIALAYATSRPVLFGRPVLLMVLFTLLFAPGIIPMFLVVKQLGLIDSLWSLILPGALGAFNFVVLRTFFMNVPAELLESARIDGASDITILRRVVMPLSKAVIAVVGLFYAVGFWNAFFNALLYLNDTSKWPVQVILRTYVLQGKSLSADQLGVEPLPQPQSLQMAVVVVALVPIALVYPFLQRHFTKGVITGAVKG